MTSLLSRARSSLAFGLVLLLALPAAGSSVSADAPALGLPTQPVAAAGFSAERLKKAETLLRREIAAGRYSGAVWLVARDGKVLAHGTAGFSDVAQRTPMTADSVFRIYSMTKIVTSVAVLSLLEEGRFNLDDPVARFLPELAQLKVLTGGTADEPQLVAARRPITIRHLLTHTSGFGYDVLGANRVLRDIYLRENLWRGSGSLKEFVAKAGRLPLAHQPGEAFTYGINTDLLGALIETVTGQPLETALRERILGPLGMSSTTFRPDAALLARLAKVHKRSPEGLKAELPFNIDLSDLAGTFASGGGGLVSTLRDYARFGQMLLNGGELDGVRVLGRKTVEMMTRNHIGHLTPRPSAFGLGVYVLQEGGETARHLYSPGQFGWSGAASTFATMDPKERVLVLLMLQHDPNNENGIFERFMNTVYQAMER